RPLWCLSCHKRRLENTASLLSICPSALLPFVLLSYSANARNPFFLPPPVGSGYGVTSPKSSVPFSIVPFPLRSKTIQTSSVLALVHAIRSLPPRLFRLKSNSQVLPVKSKRWGDVDKYWRVVTHSSGARGFRK